METDGTALPYIVGVIDTEGALDGANEGIVELDGARDGNEEGAVDTEGCLVYLVGAAVGEGVGGAPFPFCDLDRFSSFCWYFSINCSA